MITLTEKDIQELNNFIQELPLKHGLPLLNFINQKIADQKKKEEVIIQEEINS
jgi:hypothetical protein